MNLPLVTIGAINYNSALYVVETLQSISAQSYSNIELIIVDDASTDDSLCKIKEWLQHYSKPYRLIVHPQNQGVHAGYESVIQNASGTYISFISTDDLLEPFKIEQQVAAFQQLDESYGVVYGDVVDINERSQIIDQPYFHQHRLKKKNWLPPQGNVFKQITQEFLIYVQGMLIKTALVKKFSFEYKALSEDWQLVLYLARHCQFFGTDTVVAKYRRHATSVSTENRKRERYYLWCQSNVFMFHQAYHFPENTKQEKKIIANRIQFDLLDYASQSASKYADVINTWKNVTKEMPLIKSKQMLLLILWRRAKIAIKKIFFPKYKLQKLVLEN